MTDHDDPQTLLDRMARAAELLEAIHRDRALLAAADEPLRKRLLIAAGLVARPDSDAKRTLARARRRIHLQARRDADEQLRSRTGIRTLRDTPIFLTPRRQLAAPTAPAASDEPQPHSEPLGVTNEARPCYVCRKPFNEVHRFYDHMCIPCGDFNYTKRSQTADLTGRVALVTGSRVKIGYQAAILLLRAGCRVICLTRFPRDAARRYATEEDFEDWSDRLHIHGIDLRHTPSVEALCQHLLATLDRLDFIVNNACQTVRRPPGFYAHLLDAERRADLTMSDRERALLGTASAAPSAALVPDNTPSTGSFEMSQFEFLPEDRERGEHLFPEGRLDADLQQVDLREVNSWRLKLADVSAVELIEVHLINAVAPFILNARLKPLMQVVPTRDKHIVNVSAMEGQFYRIFKTDRHPHTNMAKASLNMMTRTSAADYIEDGIHMNSVDTGWVTDEDPVAHAENKREVHRFHPPLDIVDGAARIIDPIFSGLNTGKHVWGQFLKDYKITDW